jgi:hypothetical protein
LNRRIAYLCETAYARQIPFFKTGASSSRLFLRRKTETDRKHEEELKKLITIFSSFFFVKVAPFEGNAGSMLLQFFFAALLHWKSAFPASGFDPR